MFCQYSLNSDDDLYIDFDDLFKKIMRLLEDMKK